MEDTLVPIAMFAMIAAIVVVPLWLKSRERREMQSVLRAAIDKGQPVPPEVIDALTRNVKVPATALSDLRRGVIWIAIGVGIGVFGVMMGFQEHDAVNPLLGIASIPTVIGIAMIVLSFFNPNKTKV